MALAYRSQIGLDAVGLRFFTVYGPWGRPDMAPFLFAQAIRQGRPIRLHGHGRPRRDFTYVADAVDALVRLVSLPSASPLPDILNVGHGQPITLLEFVRLLEDALGQSAALEMHDLPPDDVAYTCADDRLLHRMIGPLQHTPMAQGLGQLASWLADWDPLPLCPPASTC
jgi:UDP-glucuronate 4-epimerase